jgi:hypothetical protein
MIKELIIPRMERFRFHREKKRGKYASGESPHQIGKGGNFVNVCW